MPDTPPALLSGHASRLNGYQLPWPPPASLYVSPRGLEPAATAPSGTERKRIGAGRVFLALVLGICIGVSTVAGDNGGIDALVDRSLKASGLHGQLEMLPEALLFWLPSDAFPVGKSKKEALESVRKASEEAAVRSVRSALKKDLDSEKMGKVLTFYDSKLGRKVARLQAAALSPTLISSIREGRKSAVSQDEQRLELIRRLIRAEGVRAATSKLTRSAVRGILDGAAADRESSEGEVKTMVGSAESRYRSGEDGTEEAALVAFSHTFSSLDDKELDEFASFSESEAAAWFRNTVRKGLDEAIYSTGRALGRALSSEPGRAP